ncbi:MULTISPECIES: hypothetical protein [Mycobacteroides]|uniref:ESX-1 secretion-associated protein n=2 Tax=Mycobacteroides TaxID=670516 RepID=A0A7V8LPB3_9MYCO|nr:MULTISPECIES: hypothetical protein [Mycobacteroides]AMT69231.1 hypothetical protein ABG82_01500 [Mycobacteroides immunogenum]ANO02262.1 hypothetical protein BAB75_01500 [Mycobacteroides immunogenum]KIU38282.1 hypothetical protein TL11_23490 [Mycobacteroides immunogenum]KPG11251.1 hypothetical protein AN908_12770 [Mycobacteroides immunogenum]KPG12529.1 hypothetical protein AN909_06885 [Mycobacteroides immunogenum]
MSSTIATTGDPIIQVHRGVAQSAREAAAGLPVVNSAGMRTGHAELLENALGETRKVLTELARVADIGARGAGALADQDCENAERFEGWESGELQRRGVPTGEVRVI